MLCSCVGIHCAALQAHKETELERELRTKCEALDTEKVGGAQRIDGGSDGMLSYTQRCAVRLQLTRSLHREFAAIFCLFCCCVQTGIITVAQLKKAISSLGEDIGESDLKEMIEEAKAASGEENVQYKLLIAAMYADADEEGADEEEQ